MKLTELQSKITPLPWKIEPGTVFEYQHAEIHNNEGKRIAAVLWNNDSEYLRHCANHFPALVEVLRVAEQEMTRVLSPEMIELCHAIQMTRAALAAAQEVEI